MNVSPPASASLPSADQAIDAALSRLNTIVGGRGDTSMSQAPLAPVRREGQSPTTGDDGFFPREPLTLAEAKVSESMMEELIAKYLMTKGEASIRQIANQIGMAFAIVEKTVIKLKQEQLLGYVDQAAMNDYICRLTEAGRERAKRYADNCTYFGSAPVDFCDYVESVKAQSITKQNPTEADLARAFSDLLIEPSMMLKLGPAVNSGRGMFLFGYPGNGKTSIAERITAAFGPYVWIPRAISLDRDIVRVFDPMQHVEAPLEKSKGYLSEGAHDHRWVRIKRPTIVVGGELTMEHLEIQYNPKTGISEAPVQLKSNTGLLLIDDFGRQRMSVDELLNRWIVPLEKRYDFLNTSNGKKVQVPFDQLVVFSTNLEPRDLVDDAFLRRIPYKIEVPNPSTENFIKLFAIMCRVLKVEFKPEVVQHLLEKHYFPVQRPLRNCHPRDLLLQVINYCKYRKVPVELTKETIDFACENYFSVL